MIVTSDHGERLNERHAVRGKAGHTGNPSFQEVLEVPLIIAPAIARDASAFLRTEDLFSRDPGDLAGVQSEASPDLAAGELLHHRDGLPNLSPRSLEERPSPRRRETSPLRPREATRARRTTSQRLHPDVVEAHRRRIDELGEALAARRAVVERLSEEDRERLRALGYLEQLENPH